MFPVIVVGVPVLVMVVAGLVAWAFVEVAFRQPSTAAPAREPSSWRPPIISGSDLLAWAERVAKTLTLQRLSEPRGPETARRIAEAVGDGASRAIALAKDELPAADTSCPSPSCGHRMITVTPAETLAIADAVHQQGHRATQRTRRRAEENARRSAELEPREFSAADIICPLMTSDGHCTTYAVRPLQCRAWCKLCDSDGAKCLVTGEANAHTISQGIKAGLGEALEDAGLDGRVYELNSALAAALANPNAALEWAVGEPVFAGCRQV